MSRPDIVISLPRIPLWGKVGSNRSKSHWAQDHRAKSEERDEWIELLVFAGARMKDGAVLQGEVEAHLSVLFPSDANWPDQQNVFEGYKVLIDLLEPRRITGQAPNFSMHGFAGLIENDGLLRWTGPPFMAASGNHQPRTIITLRSLTSPLPKTLWLSPEGIPALAEEIALQEDTMETNTGQQAPVAAPPADSFPATQAEADADPSIRDNREVPTPAAAEAPPADSGPPPTTAGTGDDEPNEDTLDDADGLALVRQYFELNADQSAIGAKKKGVLAKLKERYPETEYAGRDVRFVDGDGQPTLFVMGPKTYGEREVPAHTASSSYRLNPKQQARMKRLV